MGGRASPYTSQNASHTARKYVINRPSQRKKPPNPTAFYRRRPNLNRKFVLARALNRDMSVSRTSWHKKVILGRNSVFRVFRLYLWLSDLMLQ